MRLVLKLTIAIVLAITAVMAANGYARIRRELQALESDAKNDHLVLARAVAWSLQAEAHRRDTAHALELLRQINEEDPQIEVAWVDQIPAPSPAPVHFELSTPEHERVLVTRVPLSLPDTASGAIEIRESLAPTGAYARATALRIGATILESVLACALCIVPLGWMFVGRPLGALSRSIRRVGEGFLDGKLRLRQRDEIGSLAEDFDHMCEQLAEAQANADQEARRRVAALEQLRHADRLSTVGKLVAAVAHEIGTPLNVVLARARMITRAESQGPEAVEDANVIVEQVDRISAFIRQLLDLGRRGKPQLEPTKLHALASGVLRLLEPLAAKQKVVLDLDAAPEPVVHAVDVRQMQQVLVNLVMNAIQAQPDGGHVQVAVDQTKARAPGDAEGKETEWTRIRVIDDGPGADPDVLERMFEPFFTTKKPGEGTGLGLSVAQGIVEEHGGHIAARSTPGAGSEFAVLLPVPAA